MTVLIIVSIIIVLMAGVILSGKGDFLIAGFNTASKEEKAKVNRGRMRKLVSAFLLFVLAFVWIFRIFNMEHSYLPTLVILLGTTVFIVLANTWCKKR